MDWLSSKYPDTFHRHYRARLEHWGEQAEGKEGRWYNQILPMLCQVCQVPTLFTEPGDATEISLRETTYHGMKYHFCSDHCKEIFEHEPKKYVQAWIPVHQIYQGSCYPDEINPASPGDSPVREVIRYYGINGGEDNGEFASSEDRQHFRQWSGRMKPQGHGE